MDFSLKDHQKLIRDTVRQFMETEVRPLVKELEREEKFPLEIIRKLGEMGCCGMLTPEEWGGPGLDTVSYVLMIEEVARVYTAMSTALGVTNSAVQVPILQFGTEAQKQKYLKRLATGEILGSFCLTEAAAGSDAAGLQATAARVPASENVAPGLSPASSGANYTYKLSGAKTWVTNGSAAGVYIVFAKTDPAAGGVDRSAVARKKDITAFLVEPTFKGFKIGRHEDKMGQRSSPSVEILLNDCEVPAENRLGQEGEGLKIALTALDGGRIGIAAQAVGLAQGALDNSIKYAKQRKAFGKSIGEFQAIQWMLADMQTEIEAARGLLYYAAWLKDSGTAMGSAASKAKLYASEMANRVAYKAVQIHGSLGYSRETDVERMYRDARVITIYEGTSEVQRMIIARDLLR
ncbi:MAG: acyl-CoA dehydrogenase family protein [Acidobacteria bacterium]|nr:acyl-CoA dehydrogenase family protein [Acidobacteriota bacterium]MBS1867483.1 acyl-CoA dehydrogenase family protein [Acidobacteriota bacterium]